MGRELAAFAAITLIASAVLPAADQLPKHDDSDDTFEIEPPVLIPNRDRESDADRATKAEPVPVDVQRLEKDFERAKRSAAGADRLFKIGAIAKVEAEQRVLRLARLQSDLENARMALAKEALAEQEARVASDEISKADLADTETTLACAIQAAHTAAAARERAELEFAESNLHRQQKLLALGSGRKSDVSRAEQRLAELRAAKE